MEGMFTGNLFFLRIRKKLKAICHTPYHVYDLNCLLSLEFNSFFFYCMWPMVGRHRFVTSHYCAILQMWTISLFGYIQIRKFGIFGENTFTNEFVLELKVEKNAIKI